MQRGTRLWRGCTSASALVRPAPFPMQGRGIVTGNALRRRHVRPLRYLWEAWGSGAVPLKRDPCRCRTFVSPSGASRGEVQQRPQTSTSSSLPVKSTAGPAGPVDKWELQQQHSAEEQRHREDLLLDQSTADMMYDNMLNRRQSIAILVIVLVICGLSARAWYLS
eukprot:RCo021009